MIRLAPRPNKPKTPTLQQQIEQATAQERVWRDLSMSPDVIYRYWCGDSFTFVDTDPLSTPHLVKWLREHARCGRNACKVGSESSHATE